MIGCWLVLTPPQSNLAKTMELLPGVNFTLCIVCIGTYTCCKPTSCHSIIWYKSMMDLLLEVLHSKGRWERCYRMWKILNEMRTFSSSLMEKSQSELLQSPQILSRSFVSYSMTDSGLPIV